MVYIFYKKNKGVKNIGLAGNSARVESEFQPLHQGLVSTRILVEMSLFCNHIDFGI